LTDNGLRQQPAGDQPSLPSFSPNLASGTGSALAARGTPGMIGDFFGTSGSDVSFIPRTIQFSYVGIGFSTTQFPPGDPNGSLIFDVPPFGPEIGQPDLVSVGQGIDSDSNGFADTFAIAEPVAPTDAATSPGPSFSYDGGTARNPTGTYNNGDSWLINYSYTELIRVALPLRPGGGAIHVGRMKIAENSSPLPRCRVFFNYSLFDDVPLAPDGVTVNRFGPGFEHTFLNDLMSLELRAPFAGTLDTDLMVGQSQVRDVEFGDVFLSLKALLFRFDRWALATGLSLSLPTANDTGVFLTDGTELLRIENETVHLMPFVGWLYQPDSRWFTQGFIQVDSDVRGSPVIVNPTGSQPVLVAKLRDTTFLYADVSFGYWWYENPQAQRLLSIVPMLELHYNRSLENARTISTGRVQVGEPTEDIQVLNLLAASTFMFRNGSTMSIGYATPIGNSSDRQFDGELRVIWNRYF
jgi:hypothetical protein